MAFFIKPAWALFLLFIYKIRFSDFLPNSGPATCCSKKKKKKKSILERKTNVIREESCLLTRMSAIWGVGRLNVPQKAPLKILLGHESF